MANAAAGVSDSQKEFQNKDVGDGEVNPPPIRIIKQISAKYGIDYKMVYAVCLVESNCNTDRIGDSGKSYGAYQIYLPAHPDISKEQAVNFSWATEWTIKHCEKYKEDVKMFSLCHNGLGKYPRNEWYYERVLNVYNTL